MSSDKKTIGITKANHGALQRIVEAGRFESELDAAKFAMAFAVDQGVQSGRTEGADTKWNVGSIDPSGTLREVLVGLYPEIEEPYRLLEYLMNQGIERLGEQGQRPDVYGTLFAHPGD